MFLLWLLLVPLLTVQQNSECSKLIDQLIQDIISLDISKQSAPSIMFSGITTNNPGQKAECEDLAAFNYFLIRIKNTTLHSQTYTGICVPSICNKYDIEIALEDYIKCEVIDFPTAQLPPFQLTAVILLLLWVAALVLCSIVQSCRNQPPSPKKNEEQSLNELTTSIKERDDFKIFNFYEGYNRLFKKANNKHTAAVTALAIFSLLVSIEFSNRQTIASNKDTSFSMLNSFIGVLVCNTQIAICTLLFLFGINLASKVLHAKSFHQVFRFLFEQLAMKWVLLVLMSLFLYGLSGYIQQPLSAIFAKGNTADCSTTLWQIWLLFRHLQLDCKVCLPWLFLLQADILLTIVATPFIVMFRTKKLLGYFLLLGLVTISTLLSYAFLDSQGIIYLPYQLFNMQPQFGINYQTNVVVRVAPYFLGVVYGLLLYDGLDKKQAENTLYLRIKSVKVTQYLLHFLGAFIMAATYLLILNYLSPTETTTTTYIYIVLAPIVFDFGLGLFLLPCAWDADNALTNALNKLLEWKAWAHLQKISTMLLVLGPFIIAFTTFNMQNSIYYDLSTVLTYLFGDLFAIYIVCLVATAAIHSQLHFINQWIMAKLLHNKNKIILIQD